jgi:multiple inositol-polyphosphate phosphatase / 2,3-bisphosphoglycerate 3-phosphatase
LEVRTNEPDAFQTGPEYRQTLSEVNAKLGFSGSNQLSSQQMRTLWNICRFEKNLDLTIPSAWCTAFSIANNQVLEYLVDLEYYYLSGYGIRNRRLHENLNCGLMQNMLRFLQSSNANEERARIYGTHSSVFQSFLVSLGVFEDETALTRHNIAQSMNREWRTSWICPKGSNLAVIRYE